MVAEKVAFQRVTGNSSPKSLLANSARPFGPSVEASQCFYA
jgi:hypothetical protein